MSMILPKIRDKRFITVRRGGTLSDEDHRLLAVWAAGCARHVLRYFEEARPDDDRPRRAIESAHAWVNGEITMKQARFAAGEAQDAAREVILISLGNEDKKSAQKPINPSFLLDSLSISLRDISIKNISEAAKFAALSAGQAAVVAHVAAHELGAAAYAIRAVMAASPEDKKEMLRLKELQWQRDKLPEKIRDLVIDDERLRNDICWFVFSGDYTYPK